MKKKWQKILNHIKTNKTLVLLISVVIVGSFFRLYQFNDLVRFNTDQVRDVLVVEKILDGKDFPLLGPKAGGTLFKLGPVFYYFEALSGIFFGNNPSGMALFTGILAVASIPLLYYLLRYYFSVYASLLATLAYSFSFYIIKYSRFAWNPNIIPFFFFLFLLSLFKIIEQKNGKLGKWHIFLAISLAVGIQLHTLLMVLMPLLFLMAYGYIYYKERKIKFSHFSIIIAIALLFHLPFFIYDIQNNGKNIRNFFAGTEKKTQKNTSIIQNFLKDGQFFIQGNTYAISSYEPQKNWMKPRKLLASKNGPEIFSALAGSGIFIFGFILLVKNLIKEKDEKKKLFLGTVLASTILSFLILLPIANELNIRYYIIIIFLPYIFLAFLIEFIWKKIPKNIAYVIVFAIIAFLAILNIRQFAKTYNLENYTAKTSSYGGISVKESRDISNYMYNFTKRKEMSGKKFYFSPFKFSPSLEYYNDKRNFGFTDLSKYEQNSNSILFVISDKEDLVKKSSSKKYENYNLLETFKTGRFTVFAYQNK